MNVSNTLSAQTLTDIASENVGVSVAVASGVVLLASYVAHNLYQSSKLGAVTRVSGMPVVGSWDFFTKRHDFLRAGFKRAQNPYFKFNIMSHEVYALSGEEGRKVFFNNKDLSFTEGYRILMGGVPRTNDIKTEETVTHGEDDLPWFAKRLTMLLRKERTAELLPQLLKDLDVRMSQWPEEGMMNPFKNIYDLVFQLTLRVATCHEMADDQKIADKIQELYWTVEKSTTPVGLMFPWFPSQAKKNKEAATKELYTLFYQIIEERRKNDPKDQDATQVLIDAGDATTDIIGFIFGTLFAGVINTGINACWLLMFLTTYPEWKAKAREEVMTFIAKHSGASTGSLADRLAAVPPTAWEEEMPVLDVCIRETLRIILTGAALRRNVTKDLTVEGKVIPRGAFMTYLLGETHYNPDIYPEPERFDPGRYAAGREEDKKQTFAYLGWGVGRHPCLGMRFAKLELKIITALFLGAYDYDLVDANGNKPRTFPQPDRNDIYQARPIGEPTFLKYRRIAA